MFLELAKSPGICAGMMELRVNCILGEQMQPIKFSLLQLQDVTGINERDIPLSNRAGFFNRKSHYRKLKHREAQNVFSGSQEVNSHFVDLHGSTADHEKQEVASQDVQKKQEHELEQEDKEQEVQAQEAQASQGKEHEGGEQETKEHEVQEQEIGKQEVPLQETQAHQGKGQKVANKTVMEGKDKGVPSKDDNSKRDGISKSQPKVASQGASSIRTVEQLCVYRHAKLINGPVDSELIMPLNGKEVVIPLFHHSLLSPEPSRYLLVVESTSTNSTSSDSSSSKSSAPSLSLTLTLRPPLVPLNYSQRIQLLSLPQQTSVHFKLLLTAFNFKVLKQNVHALPTELVEWLSHGDCTGEAGVPEADKVDALEVLCYIVGIGLHSTDKLAWTCT